MKMAWDQLREVVPENIFWLQLSRHLLNVQPSVFVFQRDKNVFVFCQEKVAATQTLTPITSSFHRRMKNITTPTRTRRGVLAKG